MLAPQSCFLVLLVGLIAWAANAACLAPPLGVTAFLLAKDAKARTSSPRNILAGHAIGLITGHGSAFVCGVFSERSALSGSFSLGHALASALAIALTVDPTECLRCSHPPSGATTLVASLGLLPFPGGTVAFLVGTAVLSASACWLRTRLT